MLVVSSLGIIGAAPTAAAEHTFFNVRVRSFDHTFLDATVFIPEGAAPGTTPFVLMTHGWAGSRVTEPTGRVGALLDAGYGVFTWDSRGFGASGGNVELNSPDFEVKDVSAIITYIAQNVTAAKLQSRYDPVIGMTGGSYAGGIQLLSAAFDERIDVIAPEITWFDLAESLAPNGVPKIGWTTALFGAGQATSCSDGAGIEFGNRITTGCQTNELARIFAEVHSTNTLSDENRDVLLYRSPSTYMSSIDIPTLIIQGYPDTLFDVNQAAQNYAGVKANGAPVKLWLYDGGHALPGTSVPNTQASEITPTVINWFDRHLKGDTNVDTGAEVEYFLGGAWQSASAWPPTDATAQASHLAGMPALSQGPITGGAPSSFTWKIASGPIEATGPMTMSFDVSGQGTEAFIFVSLGIRTGTTVARVDGQVQPTRVAITATELARVETELISVAASVPAGSDLVVVFTTSENPTHNANRVPGIVNAQNVDLAWSTV